MKTLLIITAIVLSACATPPEKRQDPARVQVWKTPDGKIHMKSIDPEQKDIEITGHPMRPAGSQYFPSTKPTCATPQERSGQ